MCLKATLKPFLAAKRKRGLIRDISSGERDVAVLQAWVMDLLSVMNTIRLPFHL